MALSGPSQHVGDLDITGNLTVGSIDIPAASIGDDEISPTAAIAASKQVHRVYAKYQQSGTAVTATALLHTAYAAGTALAVAITTLTVAVGAATVTIDVKKNGTTILSGIVTLDTGNVAYVAETGTISVPSYATGDTYSAVVVATAGGGTLPTGLLVELILNENPS
jgi:hypothetical protein